jgi:hypothetical protein
MADKKHDTDGTGLYRLKLCNCPLPLEEDQCP